MILFQLLNMNKLYLRSFFLQLNTQRICKPYPGSVPRGLWPGLPAKTLPEEGPLKAV